MKSIKNFSYIRTLLRHHQGILTAVILQDMKTRYGASYLSYVLAILWPFTHVASLVIGYLIVNHYAPVGEDPFIFIATAAVPYMMCLYPARLIAQAIITNKPFLSYSSISPYHLIIARVVLEFMNVSVVLVLILFISYAMEIDVIPLDLGDATAALTASVMLGVSLGFLFAILAAVVGVFSIVFVSLLMILLYVGSLPLLPEYMITSRLKYYLDYNPIFCLIKWLRSAYYSFYGINETPKLYILSMAAVIFFVSLLGERMFRGRVIGN